MDSGTKVFRSKFLIKERKILDCEFYKAYPVMAKFCLPGDLWKISSNIFIRLQPMLSPSLTPMAARLRYFFVPLRLVEDNTELIITGSEDGYWSRNKVIPEFSHWVIQSNDSANMNVSKDSLISIMTGLPPGTYSKTQRLSKHWPADYWRKGYARLWWDCYRDENLFSASYPSVTKFSDFLTATSSDGYIFNNDQGNKILPVCLPHDYFTSSLPWQLKGVAPAMNFSLTGLTWNGSDTGLLPKESSVWKFFGFAGEDSSAVVNGLINPSLASGGTISADQVDNSVQSFLDNVSGQISGAFTMADFRDMSAQTRVFERLARCGSRYTEYLRANFGTSPADETLQRAQYLGGYKVPILTTEVLQTAGAVNSSDEQTPVGTLRGKGITNGGDNIRPFFSKEFGMLFCILDVRPALQYTQGLPREYTYRSRFDFFNPSFQHLSEQEVRNGEIFFDSVDTGSTGVFDNDKTWGFQAYANELRTGKTMIVGNMRGSLDYWNQGLKFLARPALNWSFINGVTHVASWNRPFEVIENTQPIIVDVYNFCEAHRPMVRYGTPGLVDHL